MPMHHHLWHLRIRLAGLMDWRPLHKGSWLAWLAYDSTERIAKGQRAGVPSRRFLRWNTRTVDKVNVGQWYREGSRKPMRLYRHEEAVLWRLDVAPIFGEPYTLWEIDHDFTRGTALYDSDRPVKEGIRHMGRIDLYRDGREALEVFQAIAQGTGGYIRPWGTCLPPLQGDAWFHLTEAHPHVLYAGDDVSEPLDVIDLAGRDVHTAIDDWLAGRAAAGLPRSSYEAELGDVR
jgi:hypothetical protein